ncbi:hypothetical protein NDU88_002463 [Pleurodeles waltl]|uniref:Uncharacterized protein n=1 Tax=Pleurodeles waltl TaxID=8319 RepID=A0AAV7L3N0_PLEWA|nr:hypothetical protein NDU88_002463 [Pleurodeles waltl]
MMPGQPHLLWGRPPLCPARSLSFTIGPDAPSRSATQQQVTPTKPATRLCPAPRGSNQHRPPPPAGHLCKAKKAPGLPERGPAPQGGSPPRALRPPGTTLPQCVAGGTSGAAVPTDRRQPQLPKGSPPGKSTCPRPPKAAGSAPRPHLRRSALTSTDLTARPGPPPGRENTAAGTQKRPAEKSRAAPAAPGAHTPTPPLK